MADRASAETATAMLAVNICVLPAGVGDGVAGVGDGVHSLEQMSTSSELRCSIR
jgi:hypothetical protein